MILEPIGQGCRFTIGQQIDYLAPFLIDQNRPI
jgi:hypothetical protein